MGLAKGERPSKKLEIFLPLESSREENVRPIVKTPSASGLSGNPWAESVQVDSDGGIYELCRLLGIPPRESLPAGSVNEQQAGGCSNRFALPTTVDRRSCPSMSIPDAWKRITMNRRD
jgi:hypothetical protein